MKSTHRIAVCAHRLLADGARVLGAGIAVTCIAFTPVTLWGQFTNTSGNVWASSSNVQIGVGAAPNPASTFTVAGPSLLNAGGTANWLPWSSGDDFIQLVSGTGFYIQSQINGSTLLMVSGQAASLGWVGIGTVTPNQCGSTGSNIPCKLTVNGAIGAKEVVVTSGITADYVFDPDYRLRPLPEVAAYVKEYHHLPEIPSAAEVKEKGVGVGDMQAKLLAKIEELTLHLIQADEKNRELQERVARLEAGGR